MNNYLFTIAGLVPAIYFFFISKKNTIFLALEKEKSLKLENQVLILEEKIINKDEIISQKSEQLKTLNQNIIDQISLKTKDTLSPVIEKLNNDISAYRDKINVEQNQVQESLINKNKINIDEIMKNVLEKISVIDKSNITQKNEFDSIKDTVNKFIRCFDHSGKTGQIGEASLKSLLESLGFVEGVNMLYQETMTNSAEEGKSLRPDFLIRLPDNRFIVLDSKVSFVFAKEHKDEEHFKKILKESIKRLVDGFQKKEYIESAKEHIKSQLNHAAVHDFNIIYVPTDASFELIIKYCSDIWQDAYKKKTIICGPSGLLSILFVIQENRNRVTMQENFEQNIDTMKKVIKDIFDIIKEFENTGSKLLHSMESYNKIASKIRQQSFMNRLKSIKLIDPKNDTKNFKITKYEIQKIQDDVIVSDDLDDVEKIDK